MSELGNGLSDARHHADALSVYEAELSTLQRLGHSADGLLILQSNLAITHEMVGRMDQALRM
jgi:hypothetical protein